MIYTGKRVIYCDNDRTRICSITSNVCDNFVLYSMAENTEIYCGNKCSSPDVQIEVHLGYTDKLGTLNGNVYQLNDRTECPNCSSIRYFCTSARECNCLSYVDNGICGGRSGSLTSQPPIKSPTMDTKAPSFSSTTTFPTINPTQTYSPSTYIPTSTTSSTTTSTTSSTTSSLSTSSSSTTYFPLSTMPPNNSPSNMPSIFPTINPTESPSKTPTDYPSANPTITPTMFPTIAPSLNPMETNISPFNTTTSDPTIPPSQSPTIDEPESPLPRQGLLKRLFVTEDGTPNLSGIIVTLVIILIFCLCLLLVLFLLNRNRKLRKDMATMKHSFPNQERIVSVSDVHYTPTTLPSETPKYVQPKHTSVEAEIFDNNINENVNDINEGENIEDLYDKPTTTAGDHQTTNIATPITPHMDTTPQ